MNTPRRMSGFTALALGISAVAITCIVSGSAIVLYGMRIVDLKSDTLVESVEAVLEQLPALRAALPPALADAVNDERRPDYVEQLNIEVDVRPHRQPSRLAETSIAVTNQGDQVISMLALRVVAMDEGGRPISAINEYVATPLAIDNEWRGPLLPGSTRRTSKSQQCPRKVGSVEYEVTELRLWQPEPAVPATEPTSQVHADGIIEASPKSP